MRKIENKMKIVVKKNIKEKIKKFEWILILFCFLDFNGFIWS